MHLRPLCLALTLALSMPALAQAPPPPADVAAVELGAGMAMFSAKDQSNVGASYGPDGTLLVDAMFPATNSNLLAALHRLGAPPVRMVVDTHWHHDHAAGNEPFARSGAVIVAHDNTRTRLASPQELAGLNINPPALPAAALPTVTFTTELTIHINGDRLRLVRVPAGHTDGDVLAYWERANVLQMGDLFNRLTFPHIGVNEGGTIDGLIAAANMALELSDDATRIIPGHGLLAKRPDLVAYRDMLVDIRSKVLAGINAKRTLPQILASKPAAKYGLVDSFVKPDVFVSLVFQGLTQPARGSR